MTGLSQVIIGLAVAALAIIIIGGVGGILGAVIANRLERRRERYFAEFVERHPWAGPSRPTLDSELNKDRTGRHGNETG
jgi:hypothetical protein